MKLIVFVLLLDWTLACSLNNETGLMTFFSNICNNANSGNTCCNESKKIEVNFFLREDHINEENSANDRGSPNKIDPEEKNHSQHVEIPDIDGSCGNSPRSVNVTQETFEKNMEERSSDIQICEQKEEEFNSRVEFDDQPRLTSEKVSTFSKGKINQQPKILTKTKKKIRLKLLKKLSQANPPKENSTKPVSANGERDAMSDVERKSDLTMMDEISEALKDSSIEETDESQVRLDLKDLSIKYIALQEELAAEKSKHSKTLKTFEDLAAQMSVKLSAFKQKLNDEEFTNQSLLKDYNMLLSAHVQSQTFVQSLVAYQSNAEAENRKTISDLSDRLQIAQSKLAENSARGDVIQNAQNNNSSNAKLTQNLFYPQKELKEIKLDGSKPSEDVKKNCRKLKECSQSFDKKQKSEILEEKISWENKIVGAVQNRDSKLNESTVLDTNVDKVQTCRALPAFAEKTENEHKEFKTRSFSTSQQISNVLAKTIDSIPVIRDSQKEVKSFDCSRCHVDKMHFEGSKPFLIVKDAELPKANGVYEENGMLEGKPKYKNHETNFEITWNSDEQSWCLRETLASKLYNVYRNRNDTDVPNQNGWEKSDPKNCPGGHKLRKLINVNIKSNFNCDACGNKIPHKVKKYDCRLCNYDLCDNCFVNLSAEGCTMHVQYENEATCQRLLQKETFEKKNSKNGKRKMESSHKKTVKE